MATETQAENEAERDGRPARGANPRLRTSVTLAALPGLGGGAVRLRNLSTTGACVEVQGLTDRGRVEPGSTLDLKLAHPRLSQAQSLTAETVWLTVEAEPLPETLRLGLRFLRPKRSHQVLQPFLTAEAGSCVFQEERLVGFVVPHGKDRRAFSLFEASGKRLAVAALDETGYQVRAKTKRPGSLPSFHAPSLYEATCQSIGVEGPLRLEPPAPEWETIVGASPAETPTEASRAPGNDPLEAFAVCPGDDPPVGYAALTGEGVWSIYNAKERQIAFVEVEGARCIARFSDMSAHEVVGDEALKATLATIFELDGFPELSKPVVIRPATRTLEGLKTPDRPPPETKEALGRSVRSSSGELGHLCQTELPHSWVVVDHQGEQLAFLAGSAGSTEVQICSMGDAIDDDLEFQVFPDLKSAVACAFQLEGTAEDLQIGELAPVGEVTPVLVEDSASSVDLKPGAVQVTLRGFPPAQAEPARANKPAPDPKRADNKPQREALPLWVWPALAILVSLLAFVLYEIGLLVFAYTR